MAVSYMDGANNDALLLVRESEIVNHLRRVYIDYHHINVHTQKFYDDAGITDDLRNLHAGKIAVTSL